MTKNAFDQVKEIFGSRCEQTVIDRETCAKIVIDEAHDIEISGCGTKKQTVFGLPVALIPTS